MAYVSDQTGREEVFVTTFPSGDRNWQVSTAGGTHPSWSDDGLFYVSGNTLMATEVRWGSALPFIPEPLFSGDDVNVTLFTPEGRYLRKYAVSNDGRRILVIRRVPESAMKITVAQNFRPNR